MTFVEKIGILILVIAILLISGLAFGDKNTVGRWVAEQAYFVNSPLGMKYACRLDFWEQGMDMQEVPLICVPWDDSLELRYIGQKDGELVLRK